MSPSASELPVIDKADLCGEKCSKFAGIVVGGDESENQQVSIPQRGVQEGSVTGFEMSVGLPVAQARPSSGLVRGRAGVHEMVDILAIAGYSGARLYRGQSSLYKIVAKPTPGCAAVVLTSCVGKPPETRVPESLQRSRRGARAECSAPCASLSYSAIDCKRINVLRRYTEKGSGI